MPRRTAVLRLVIAATSAAALALPLLSPVSPNAGAAAATVIEGPDVSHYQHPGSVAINWTKVAKAGKAFAISKATEGDDYTDPYFATDYAGSLAAGLVHGSYHFARPGFPIASTAIAQAQYYAATIGAVTTAKTLPPALDLEVNGGLNPAQLVTWAQDFLLEMRTLTGRTPILYTYPSFYEYDLADPTALSRYPLWMAHYGTTDAPVSDLWQFTDDAKIKGIPGGVDESVFEGTTGFPWATLSNGTIATPWKASAPAAPVSPQAAPGGGQVTVSWLPGDSGTSPVTDYTVTASPGGETVTVGPSVLSATVTGLSTTTSYTFTVTATNQNGVGPASVPTAAVTPSVPTSLTATVQPAVRYGKSLPVSVLLRRADTHAALTGQPVLVFRRASSSGSWSQIRDLSTNQAGRSSTLLTPTRSAQLEVVFPGARGVSRATKYANYVVRPTLTWSSSATTAKRGSTVLVEGTVSPFTAGQAVVRQRFVDGRWRNWAQVKVGPRGGFLFRLHPKAKGVATYRIVVPATARLGASYSPTFTLTVR